MSVCPVIGLVLRTYSDVAEVSRRQSLFDGLSRRNTVNETGTRSVHATAARRSDPVRPQRATAVTGPSCYLTCPSCGLTITVRAECLSIEHCPRCGARGRALVKLFASTRPTAELHAGAVRAQLR